MKCFSDIFFMFLKQFDQTEPIKSDKCSYKTANRMKTKGNYKVIGGVIVYVTCPAVFCCQYLHVVDVTCYQGTE